MIIRFLWLTALFFLLNLKALADTVVVNGWDQDGRIQFYTGTDEYSAITAEEGAKSKCVKIGMRLCQPFYRFKRKPSGPPECLATFGLPWQGLDRPFFAVAPTQSAAISYAEAQCKALGPSCRFGTVVCDTAPPISSVEEIVPSRFDGSTLEKIINHVHDDLKSREALIFYAVAFGFGLFVLLSLYDVITNDRRSVSRMVLNLFLSCVVAGGVMTTGLVAPPVWGWMLSLNAPALVFLGTVTVGVMLLLIPRRTWRRVKEPNTLARTSPSQSQEESTPRPKCLSEKILNRVNWL
jgi:hypothetical protein